MDPCRFKAPKKLLSTRVCIFPRPAWGKFHVYMYGCTLVFICVCLYVGLTMFNEKTNIHTYIQTNILSFSQLRFCDTSKLKSYVCLPMQAVEIYNQHGKSTVFSKTRNLHFHGQGYVFRRKPQKNVKSEL